MTVTPQDLDRAVDFHRTAVIELATKIHEHPELRYEEHQACAWICELLEARGKVQVERDLGGVATAFRARVGQGGPRIAILAEYDALPEIGHACGHNLIAGGATGAFLALAARAQDLPGTVEIIGTPAEEGGAGKVKLIDAGVFEGVDAAMMYHPFDRDLLTHPALASLWLTMEFSGTPSHAAMAPFDGASALTACMQTFQLVDSQRVHFRDGVRVHGFVTNGGQAVNIIPERAACEFSVRARTKQELERVRAIVERCAKGAALACDVQVDVQLRTGYREMRNNLALAEVFADALRALGRTPKISDEAVGAGSTDMGDVSQVVPSIHPYLAICDEWETACHQHRFAECAKSERGFETMVVAAKALARSTLALLVQPELLAAARSEYEGETNR
jgi:amidohydrolase